MKMKKGLLSAAFLLTASSAMAAMSFSSAEIESDAKFTVTNSGDALLALEANDTHAASSYNKKGELEINLDKGRDGKEFGVQNSSTYEWDKLFTVKNNSEAEIKVEIDIERDGKKLNSVDNASAAFWPGFPGWPPGNGDGDDKSQSSTIKIVNANDSNKVEFTLKPGRSMDIDLDLINTNQDGTPEKEYNYDINVKAERTDGK